MTRFRLKNPTEIGALIRARRQALGMDQAELAEKVGVSRLWINQVERGKPGAGIGLVLRTLTAVGVDLGWTEPVGDPRENDRPPAKDVRSVIKDIIEDAKRKSRR
jgi:HTH-type transcriptional regulator/antitoxin HipB